MPSSYCSQHPFVSACVNNPNYVPPGGIYSPGASTPTIASILNAPVYFPTGDMPATARPSTRLPQILGTSGGVQVSTDRFQSILDTFLSAFALHKGAKGVPTRLSNENDGYSDNSALSAYLLQQQLGGQYRTDGTAAGQAETWVKNNPGKVAVAIALAVAYLAKSPRSKAR